MEGFTLIDGLISVVIVLSAILAYSRGLVREAMAIAGWVGAAVLAFVFAESAQPLVKEIPVLGDFLKDSCELSINIDAAVPDDAPGWILSRYNTLTKACAEPETAAPAEAAPPTPTAPSN
jgi:hypothetical protein